MNQNISYLVLSLLFGFLLIFPQQAMEASKSGLLLWFDTLLPTLLPSLIVSQLILKTSFVEYVQKITGPAFQKIFHCSDNGSFCMLCGFLCGYPVGARLIALQVQDGNLNIDEGQYLLGFCNNVSPAFCISYGILYAIGTNHVLPYLIIIYGSALLFGFLKRPKHPSPQKNKLKKQTSSAENIFQLIDVCIIDSFLIMIKLCGYLILFSIISTGILMLLTDTPIYVPPVITSFLEITSGLSKLTVLPQNALRTSIGIAALSFGGLCCTFQTNSVISGSGLSLKKYILHKTLITCLSLLFFFLWFFFHSFPVNGWG